MFKRKRRLSLVFLAVFLMMICAPNPSLAIYSDTDGSWAAEVIEKASAYGLMEGYPNGRFGIGDPMKRGEFVAVLCRVFQWELTVPEQPTYLDCPPSHWAYPYVETAAAQGALEPSDTFQPDEYILRGDLAKMLVRGMGYDTLAQSGTVSNLALPFPDVREDLGYVALAYDFGIVRGIPAENGTLRFLPNDSTPREQAAAMLVRCYERRMVNSPDWVNGFYTNLLGIENSQLHLTDQMSVVSAAWGRLWFQDEDTHYTFTTSSENNNSWYIPASAREALQYWEQRGVDCHFSVQASAKAFNRTVDAGQIGELVAQLVEAAEPYDGLDIDFEGLNESRRDDFTEFIARLRASLPMEKALTVCVNSCKYYKGYDFRALGELCDKIIYMSHSFGWTQISKSYLGKSNTYTPYAPLNEVCRDLHEALDPVTGVQDPSKLALQICFGSVGVQVDEAGLIQSTTIYHPGINTMAKRLCQPDSVRIWDETAASPCLSYSDDEGNHYMVWYEDAESVQAKLDLARMFGVNSVSVWWTGSVPCFADIPNYDLSSLFQVNV